MDEQKLADLFRDAAHDAPPASFDASDVRTASRRATLRRRNSIAAGTTLVVVLGLGGVVAGAGWFGSEKSATMNSAGPGQQKDESAPTELMTPLQVQPKTQDFPGDASTQGDASTPGSAGFTTGAPRAVQGCAAVDRELADALAGELSVSPGLAEAPSVTCSPDSRAATFKINGVTITAIVTPQEFKPPDGARTEKAKTAAGQDLYVLTQGDGALKDQVRSIADALAPRF
ncbi:hypothetical protein [Lentzea sp. NPDC004782]|uniref:hypothetical protein n=1 Tax=Lentzea sp. NPDC004782 TaxID=3154458 RepID=UPI0033AD569F